MRIFILLKVRRNFCASYNSILTVCMLVTDRCQYSSALILYLCSTIDGICVAVPLSLSTIASKLIGNELASHIARVSVYLYTIASQYALARGLILADTKFEFGLISLKSPYAPSPNDVVEDTEEKYTRSVFPPFYNDQGEQLILIDELLTPDSSRYWPKSSFVVGQPQPSFDKQYLRDWLVEQGFEKGLEEGKDGEGWTATEEVVKGTAERYAEALRILTSPASK